MSYNNTVRNRGYAAALAAAALFSAPAARTEEITVPFLQETPQNIASVVGYNAYQITIHNKYGAPKTAVLLQRTDDTSNMQFVERTLGVGLPLDDLLSHYQKKRYECNLLPAKKPQEPQELNDEPDKYLCVKIIMPSPEYGSGSSDNSSNGGNPSEGGNGTHTTVGGVQSGPSGTTDGGRSAH